MTGKKIRELFLKAPNAIKEALESDETSQIILEIGKKYGLTIDKTGDLSYTTSLMMVGVIPAHSYISELKQVLDIPEVQINEIAKEINARIFRSIREELKRIHGESVHEPLISETPGVKSKIDLIKSVTSSSGGAPIPPTPRSIPVNGNLKQAPALPVAPKPASVAAVSLAPQTQANTPANMSPKPPLPQTNFWSTVNKDLKKPVSPPVKIEISQKSVPPTPKPPLSVPIKTATSVKLNAVEAKPGSAVNVAPINVAGAANLTSTESAKRSNLHEEVHRLLAEHFESTSAVSQTPQFAKSAARIIQPAAPKEIPAPKITDAPIKVAPLAPIQSPGSSYPSKDPYREPVDDHNNS